MLRRENPLQSALVEYVQSINPDRDRDTAKEIERVRAAVAESGRWQEFEEWRISTFFDSSIDTIEIGGQSWFKVKVKVRVECDGQEFICRCPTLDKAVLLAKFYRRLIVDQFYSVGPPWA